MLFKKLKVSFIIFCLSLVLLISPIYAIDVVIGGESIGIVLNYDGICITGFYEVKIDNQFINPAQYFNINDIIIKVDNENVENINDLSTAIKNSKSDIINFTIKRDSKIINKQMKIFKKNGQFSTGLYVKDSIQGIGTVTYYQLNTGQFASLGHTMIEENITFKNGSIYNAPIQSIKKSEFNSIGQKIGNIETQKIGEVEKNCDFGIYGKLNNIPSNCIYKTALMDEVKLGTAYFFTVLEGNKVEKCEIEITELLKQDRPEEKGIKFILTDSKIIDKCHGIIQGMSGSPIIQNNKLIGCVTHASKSNNLEGYGMYIQWLIDNE